MGQKRVYLSNLTCCLHWVDSYSIYLSNLPQQPTSQEFDRNPTTALRHQDTVFGLIHSLLMSDPNDNTARKRQTTTYEIGVMVSAALSALDRASTDDKQMLGRVLYVIEDYDSYGILTEQ